MNYLPKLIILLLFIHLIDAAASLPEDWYKLPENNLYSDRSQNQISPLKRKDSSDDLEKLTYDYQRLLRSNSRVASQIKYQRSGGWRLAEFHTGMAFSTSGKIGIVSAKGKAGIELRFRRKNLPEKGKKTSNSETPPEQTIKISENMSKKEIRNSLKPIIKYLVSKTDIQNQSLLEENLMKSALNFQKTVLGLGDRPSGTIWWPYKFKYQIWIDASGTVYETPTTPISLGIGVGGKTNLALYWLRLERKGGVKKTKSSKRKTTSLKLLSQTLSRDINSSFPTKSTKINPPYYLDTVRITIGQSVSGNIFVAKTEMGAKGSLYFKKHSIKRTTSSKKQKSLSTLKTYSVLSKISKDEVDYANMKNISYKPLKKSSGKRPTYNIYKVSRTMFRNGLRKAVRMANFFSSKSLDDSKAKWFLREMRPKFSLSIGGDFFVTTVKQHSAVTFMIKRKK